MALQPVDRDSLRERIDVLEVVGNYVRLTRMGAEWRGLCPFHDERTPSFYVNPTKGLWICRGQCATGGDIFDFVMRAERLEFREAAELLANRIGCTMATNPGQARRSEERERLHAVCGLATQLFERALWRSETGRTAREYLARRGLSEETIRRFRLGYAPDGWDFLARHFERQGVSMRDAEAAGLVRARRGEGGYYDRFRHRVMFPILDSQDRTMGFGGRVLRADDEPKYLNTAETAIFHKGSVLYGLPFAVGELGDGAVVVEGYMDVIALHQHGVRAALATLGTALTSGHLRLLRRHTERIILCYDADNAGRRATDRAAVLFIEEGIEGRVLNLPDGQDPDEYIGQHGQEAFAELVRNAPDLITHQVEKALAGAGAEPLARATAVRDAVVPILAEISDPLRHSMVQRRVVEWWSGQSVGMAEEFERSLALAVREQREGERSRARTERGSERRQRPSAADLPTREARMERDLLADLLAHPSLRQRARELVAPELISQRDVRAIYKGLVELGDAPLDRLADALDEGPRALLADLACRAPRPAREAAAAFELMVAELKVNALQSQAEGLREERAKLNADDFEGQAEVQRRIHGLERELDQARQRLLGYGI